MQQLVYAANIRGCTCISRKIESIGIRSYFENGNKVQIYLNLRNTVVDLGRMGKKKHCAFRF